MENAMSAAVVGLPALATRLQVAEFVGCSKTHIANQKEIPFVKVGRLARYRREDVLAYLSKLAGGTR